MATNMDKGLYQAPQGLESLGADEEGIEVEIVDPEEVNIEGPGFALSLMKDEVETDFDTNLAEEMPEGALLSTASDLESEIDNDKGSRKEWEKTYTDGLKLLGLQIEERTEPWNGACGVFHPMLTEAIVRFQAETITETFPAQGPVRTKILGKETPEIKEIASNVEDDMNYELTERMSEYRHEHERMLWSLPATGSAFKKVYFDPNLGRQVSMFVPAEDVLLPYGNTDMDTCYRLTHIMRKTKNEIIKLQQAGFYRDVELPDPTRQTDNIQQAKDKETGFNDLNDDRYVLYEIHADLDLEGYEDVDDDGEETGIMLPYVVTLIKGTDTVLSIRRNWREDDPLKRKREYFVHYQYIPGFGAYGFGLFHLVGGFAKNATSLMRQLVDAGTLSNLPGGLKSRGLRIKGDDTPIAPGEWRDVDVSSGNIRDSILPLPYKEPSAVLYQLLGNIVEEGRRFAATADMKVSDMSAQAPVGTTLALLERQLKVMTAVQARIHFSLKKELKLIKNLIRDYADTEYSYTPEYGERRARKEDYDMVDIIPVSDPNAATMSQRVVQYQAVIQMAQMAPDIYDLPQLHRGMLAVLGIKNADKLIPLEDDMKPTDPVSENMCILKSEPVKAFLYQDHESHIRVHMAAVGDPQIAELMGQNPRAQQIQSAMAAHISEHVAYAYRQKIEQQLGFSLPPEGENLPPEVETALSTMMAQAAQQVLQTSQSEAAKRQAEQQMQDPVVQMQMQELQIKQQEVQLKEKKIITDAAAKADELALRKEEVKGRLQMESMKVGAKIQDDKTKMAAQQSAEGVRLGIDVAKSKQQHELQMKQAALQHLQHVHNNSNKQQAQQKPPTEKKPK
jgi:hypothetical protein